MRENKFYSPFSQLHEFPKDKYLKFAEPYWERHQNPTSDIIVICLHGFRATTYETKTVARELFKFRFDTAESLFQGHGLKSNFQAKKQMNLWTYKELLESTRKTIQEAQKLYRTVYLYGQSMGGTIALKMAEEHRIDGVAVTSPALKFNNPLLIFVHLFWWLGLHIQKVEPRPFFNERYNFVSLKAVKQILKLARKTRKNLQKITDPILVCQSKKDDVVNHNGAHLIREEVLGVVQTAWFNESGHTLPLDVQKDMVIQRICKFFRNL